MKDKITYHMYNRMVRPDQWEIIFYNQDVRRIFKVIVHKNNFNLLIGEALSPMDVYYKTNGTMGY